MVIIDYALVWLIVWICKNAIMDVSHAVNGTPNPRYELKKAKAKAAGQTAPPQPRYGSRDWFDDLLSDGLQAQTEWRRRRAAAKRAARDQRDQDELDGQAGFEDDVEDAPAEDGRNRNRDERDRDRQEAGGPDAEAGRRSGGRPAEPPYPPGRGDGSFAGGRGVVHTDQPRRAPEQQPASPDRANGSTPDDAPPTNVIPIHRRFADSTQPQFQPTEGDATVATEVIGLDQSIAYAANLKEFAGQHGSAGNEGYIGHLSQSQVAGEALSSAHQMQEAFDNAMAAAERHQEELERQKAVQEQYDANPDAGDKDFQQEGR